MSSQYLQESKILRVSDGQLLKAMVDIAAGDFADVFQHLKVGFGFAPEIVVSKGSFDSDPSLAELLNRNGVAIQSVRLVNGTGHELVNVRREFGSGQDLFDKLILSPGDRNHNPLSPERFSGLVEICQGRFRLCISENIVDLLGPEISEHFKAREQALSRLESLCDLNFEKLNEERGKLRAEYDAKTSDLEASVAAQREKLEIAYTEKDERLTTREKELEKRREELDDRSNMHVRREIRDKFLAALKEEDRFSLTQHTLNRRRLVFGFFLILLLFFLVPAVLFLWKEFRTEAFDWTTYGLRVGFSIGFVVTMGFFIRWLNTFSAKSIQEEYKQKQLRLDFDRASWLVELYFESLVAGDKQALPVELMTRLSQNLFVTDDGKPETVTAADTIASALFTTAGKVRIPIPGGGFLEMDKQGIKKLTKEEVE